METKKTGARRLSVTVIDQDGTKITNRCMLAVICDQRTNLRPLLIFDETLFPWDMKDDQRDCIVADIGKLVEGLI